MMQLQRSCRARTSNSQARAQLHKAAPRILHMACKSYNDGSSFKLPFELKWLRNPTFGIPYYVSPPMIRRIPPRRRVKIDYEIIVYVCVILRMLARPPVGKTDSESGAVPNCTYLRLTARKRSHEHYCKCSALRLEQGAVGSSCGDGFPTS